MRWSAVAALGIAIVNGSIVLAEIQAMHVPENMYTELREQALKYTAASLRVHDEVFGVAMETGYPKGVATLVSFIDGSTSLYLSTGGGTIGAGNHPGPAGASQSLVRLAARNTQGLSAAASTPLPQVGYTRFYVLTQHGILTTEAKEEDLGEGRHPLSPLFYAAQDVITEIRKVEESKQ